MGSSSTPRLYDAVPLAFLVPRGNPLNARWNMVRLAMTHLWQSLAYRDLASFAYFDRSPHSRLGGAAMKLCFRPAPRRGFRCPADYVDRLKQRLERGSDRVRSSGPGPCRPRSRSTTPRCRGARHGRRSAASRSRRKRSISEERLRLGERISYFSWNCLEAQGPVGTERGALAVVRPFSGQSRLPPAPFRQTLPRSPAP